MAAVCSSTAHVPDDSCTMATLLLLLRRLSGFHSKSIAITSSWEHSGGNEVQCLDLSFQPYFCQKPIDDTNLNVM
jgi:hypothetical protein